MKEYRFYYIETICRKETFRETGWLDRHNEETNGKFNGSLIVLIPLQSILWILLSTGLRVTSS